tara:strand:+ start:46501 stop:47184 length:684 start_codon:yes stop_codon:yes gene_type:complete
MKTLNKQKKEILIIDDDVDIINFVEKILENAGYSTIYAESVEESIAMIERFAPHLILLDYKLDKERGTKLFHFLNKSEFSKIPVIMMSSLEKKTLHQECLTVGAKDFIHKPLTPSTLLQRIKKHLKEYQLPVVTFDNNDHPIVQVSFPVECLKINEISMIIQSGVKLAPKLNVEIKGPFLKKVGMDICKYETTGESKVVNPGTYNTEILIKGLDEPTSKKIRQMRGM